jgi:preprotein translocase subunit YajC
MKDISMKLLSTMVFNPGDFVITVSGQKGYIIESTDSTEKFFYVRIGNRYLIKSADELKLDPNHEKFSF